MHRCLWVLLFFAGNLFAEISEFQRFMGKDTSHWVHVSKEEDIFALQKFEEIYEKNKLYLFSEKEKVKIPKTIHFIWLGPKPFPPQSVENVRTWLAHHPEWEVKFWTDRDRPAPCSCMEVCKVENFPFLFLQRCYDLSENWGEKSDILRFEILYQEGGLYVDHDANCLQNFDALHMGYDFYCGLEMPHPPFAGRNITCGNGIIGSRSFHPVVGRVIELIGKEWESLGHKYRGRDGYSKTQLVMERTYMKLTNALIDRLNEDENIDIVFPAAYFFAKKGVPSLYSEHFFANAWADEEWERDKSFEKNTAKVLNQLQKKKNMMRWIGRGALSINLLAFSGICLYLVRQKRRKRF